MSNKVTLSGRPPELSDCCAAPGPIDPKTGQHTDYWILSEEERKKGFVRPVRRTYIHVGCRPKFPTRELTAKEHEEYDRFGYVAYEAYPESEHPTMGRYWTQKQLESGCQTSTRMNEAIAETYSRDPKFYGATFCAYCGAHFPVGEQGEFVWEDGSRVGT